MLRGQVRAASGAPLPGVIIAVLGHPEFGQTLTRANGLFDLAVNGGGPLTVSYGKAGYIPVHRQVEVPWQEFVRVPEVVMTAYDPTVSSVDPRRPEPFQVAVGSTTHDGLVRTPALLFPQGTTASMVLPGGGTEPLTPPFGVRATEFTVGPNGPQAMPAELPATSAYTYAVGTRTGGGSKARSAPGRGWGTCTMPSIPKPDASGITATASGSPAPGGSRS